MEIKTYVDVEVTDDKPYNKCIKCRHLGVRCDGPNFAAMTIDRIVEWIAVRKKYLGWSNAKLAEESNTPKGTIDRILAGHHTDFKMLTIQPILKALVGGSWGQYPCADPDNAPPDVKTLVELLAAKESEVCKLREEIDKAEVARRSDVFHAEESANSRTEFLKTRMTMLDSRIAMLDKQLEKERARFLAVVSVASVLASIIIIALMVDKFNPDIGFFWLK